MDFLDFAKYDLVRDGFLLSLLSNKSWFSFGLFMVGDCESTPGSKNLRSFLLNELFLELSLGG